MTAMTPVASRTVPQETVGQVGAGSCGCGVGPDPAAGGGAARGASLVERGYVHARFGGVPVLVGPELAAQLRADRQKQP
jgi:hypothetical protein